MAKLYFLGGESVVKQDSKYINELAFREAADSPRVLVFPWARTPSDKTPKRLKRLFSYFRNIGAGSIELADYDETFEDISRKVECSDLVYLTGGFTTVLLERLRKKNITPLLRNYGKVIVGRSAGALALCKKCFLTDRHKSLVKIVEGLGIVDFGIKVHYEPSGDVELKRLSKNEKIYAIPERSALVYDSKTLSFIGDVYIFKNGEKTHV
ncbi:hypothetical protein E2P30_02355 [Candidatus Bathyarchaeota archaeon]|nr:hypothetical protein E2P30_02355 [Candidatus Bathyarchaeota archaeon]